MGDSGRVFDEEATFWYAISASAIRVIRSCSSNAVWVGGVTESFDEVVEERFSIRAGVSLALFSCLHNGF